MAKQDYTPHQQAIISQYYDQLDTIMLSKLQELVSELYLTESETKKKRLWDRVHTAMIRLNAPTAIIDHIMARKDVEVLAKNVQEWFAHSTRKK